jgi:hypothetical protein
MLSRHFLSLTATCTLFALLACGGRLELERDRTNTSGGQLGGAAVCTDAAGTTHAANQTWTAAATWTTPRGATCTCQQNGMTVCSTPSGP